MARTNITTGVQTVTATGAVTGSLDTSALSGDFTVKIRIVSLSSASGTPTCIIALQDTANASAFSEAIDCAVVHANGTVLTVADKTFPFKKQDISNTRFGVANSKLRLYVWVLGGTTPSLKVEGWIEQ